MEEMEALLQAQQKPAQQQLQTDAMMEMLRKTLEKVDVLEQQIAQSKQARQDPPETSASKPAAEARSTGDTPSPKGKEKSRKGKNTPESEPESEEAQASQDAESSDEDSSKTLLTLPDGKIAPLLQQLCIPRTL